ncbi:MAG: post-transcriptional regulator [Vulcanibacillus sp.]
METEELNKQIEGLCISKAEEFYLMGYKNISGESIWECVREKYKGELPMLHIIVNDILSLKVTTYMNWMTMKAYKGLEI